MSLAALAVSKLFKHGNPSTSDADQVMVVSMPLFMSAQLAVYMFLPFTLCNTHSFAGLLLVSVCKHLRDIQTTQPPKFTVLNLKIVLSSTICNAMTGAARFFARARPSLAYSSRMHANEQRRHRQKHLKQMDIISDCICRRIGGNVRS